MQSTVQFGTTFRFVSHHQLINSRPAADCMRPRGLRRQTRDVIYSPNPEESKLSAQSLLTRWAQVCTIFRLGPSSGKGRLFHQFPATNERHLQTDLDKFQAVLAKDKNQHHLRVNNRAFITGGSRTYGPSINFKDALKTRLGWFKIPFTILWGLPDSDVTFAENHYDLSVLSCPKLGSNGTAFIGIMTRKPNAQTPVDRSLLDARRIPLKRASANRHAETDALVTPQNWSSYFSDITILKGDRVFVGDQQVWPPTKTISVSGLI